VKFTGRFTNKRIWIEDTKKYTKKILGGRGINFLIMINEITPQLKFYGPENLLCFRVGSLAGIMAPGICGVVFPL